MLELLKEICPKTNDRVELCCEIVNHTKAKTIAEIGVYKGDFAKKILSSCKGIEKYYFLDPWRNLSDWNKPANKTDDGFESIYREFLSKTDIAGSKRIVLRGKTTEVIDQIEDESLDFAYVDGDHTLKGICIDLINVWGKLKTNGILIGDDFCPSIWQHDVRFEPTMVFPFAVYFAEAVDAKIYILPFNQFLISKKDTGFEKINLTNSDYDAVELKNHLTSMWKPTIKWVLNVFRNGKSQPY